MVTKKDKIIYKHYLKKRAERPRLEGGCDHGAKRAVLVRKGSLELQWRFACKSWASLLDGYQPEPAALELVDTSKEAHHSRYLYNDGGRLSKALIMQFQKEIDKFFGEETAEFVHPRMTLLLGPSIKDRK